jgi:diguanylate cyclase (GGDEF)-like protein/PAS domain S-box-containing protein
VQGQLQQALDSQTQALDQATQARSATEVLLAEQRAILASDFIGLIRIDLASHGIVWSNNAACRMLGYASGALTGLPTRELFVSQEDYEGFGEKCMAALQSGSTLREEIQQLRKDGSSGWFQISVGLLNAQIAVAAIVDVTERKRAEDETAYLAYFDALTGLANRRLLNNRIRQALAQSKRSNRFGALLFLDLDNFKPLNDSHGHELGDLMLKEVASRLTQCVREVDTVARFGGDEFVVLLVELDSDATRARQLAADLAEKIRVSLAAPYQLEAQDAQGEHTRVTHTASASMGVVLFGNGQPSVNDLLVRGDAAMYAAKAEGRNRVKVV